MHTIILDVLIVAAALGGAAVGFLWGTALQKRKTQLVEMQLKTVENEARTYQLSHEWYKREYHALGSQLDELKTKIRGKHREQL